MDGWINLVLISLINLCLQVAVTDVLEAAKDADILVWVLPHQFVRGICKSLKGKIKKDAIAVSLIKVRHTWSASVKNRCTFNTTSHISHLTLKHNIFSFNNLLLAYSFSMYLI